MKIQLTGIDIMSIELRDRIAITGNKKKKKRKKEGVNRVRNMT